MKFNNISGNRGFTLIELIVVIAILGILALMVTPSISEVLANSSQLENDSHVAVVNSASKQYEAEYGERANGIDDIENAQMLSLKKEKYDYDYDKETGKTTTTIK